MNLYIYKSKIGNLAICSQDKYITQICLENEIYDFSRFNHKLTPEIDKACTQLEEYFNQKRKEFSLELKLEGTKFQKTVWNELMNIKYGETKTYSQIAQLINNPKSCRAVGNANNKNPVLIVIPCHRVIGQNGSLTGYRGGLEIKKKLLELEGIKIC